MFGSLVVVFPTPHEGGALLLRHGGQEWTFDSAAVLSVASPSSIAYTAFFSDIEHEVLPVMSGHRVTLTYNLYFDDDERASAKDLVLELPSVPQEENERSFRLAFKALLENSEFLPDGGTLVFGLQHVYQVEDTLEHVYGLLKGSDAIVYQNLRALGFEPVLYFQYERDGREDSGCALIDSVPDFKGAFQIEDLMGWFLDKGGIWFTPDDPGVTWVTPVMRFNRREDAFMAHGNEPSLDFVYRDVCLAVRIGEVGKRLAYTTVAQLKEEAEERGNRSWYI
jgi:hypothetical protein